MLRCLTVLLMMLFMSNVQGKIIRPSEKYDVPLTLSDYITSVCHKGCVDQGDLLKSVRRTASILDIDFKDLISIVKVESRFQRKATSKRNKGLMQVNVGWHKKKLQGRNIYDTAVNIEIGGTIYKSCLNRYDDNRSKSLRCYNGNGDKKYVSKIDQARRDIDKLVDLNTTEYEKENEMQQSTSAILSAKHHPTNKQLKEEVDSHDDVKELIIKPYGDSCKILSEKEYAALPEAKKRFVMWAILILKENATTHWLIGGSYSKQVAEDRLKAILAA